MAGLRLVSQLPALSVLVSLMNRLWLIAGAGKEEATLLYFSTLLTFVFQSGLTESLTSKLRKENISGPQAKCNSEKSNWVRRVE